MLKKIVMSIGFLLCFCNNSFSEDNDQYYESILAKLNKSYIINHTINESASNCLSYQLTDSSMIMDSIDYFNGVREFFECDPCILHYLTKFENDTSKCNWIRVRCSGAARFTRPSFLISEKRIAALILIENYLDNYNDSLIQIPRIPNIHWVDNNQNLCLLDYKTLKVWLKSCNRITKETYRDFFKYGKRPWYRVYDYIDIEEKWHREEE